LVDDLELAAWAHDLCERIRHHPTIELVAILVAGDPDSGADCTTFAKLLLAPLLALGQKSVARHRRRSGVRKDGSFAELQAIPASRSGEEPARIQSLKLDAIVSCVRRPPEEIVASARDGAITIRFGRSSGRLAGFEEVLDGSPVTQFAIERLNGRGSELLFQGSITTQLFWSQNQSALFERATPYILQVLGRLADRRTQGSPPGPAVEQAARKICARDVAAYAWRTSSRVAQKAWRHARGREWNWGVAYICAPWQDADLSTGKILPKLPGTFVADPFVAESGDKRYIFVEEFPYSTRKGVISVFELDEAGATRLGVALEEPYHLSFPFVFQKDGTYYMAPEGQGGGELVLYECADFPLQWRRKKVIMRKVCADTIIFEHDARWWMLTSVKGDGRAENSAELHAFYAEDPLGEWQPHSENPVVMDAWKGRNGGILTDEAGETYRIAQRAGFRTYGDGFAIFRIDELTPDSYRETLVREIKPDFFPGLAGAHHLHSRGGLTVYDFSRDERP
jgi:hypothetical protein